LSKKCKKKYSSKERRNENDKNDYTVALDKKHSSWKRFRGTKCKRLSDSNSNKEENDDESHHKMRLAIHHTKEDEKSDSDSEDNLKTWKRMLLNAGVLKNPMVHQVSIIRIICVVNLLLEVNTTNLATT
jgi:hypothetical protein